MSATHQLPRHARLYRILDLMNRIHRRRRLLGLRTDHLSHRCRILSRAWLDCRPL